MRAASTTVVRVRSFSLGRDSLLQAIVLGTVSDNTSLIALRSSVMTDQIRPAEYGRPAREAGLGFLNRYQNSIDWVLQEFGSHGSADLELESTIIYVDREAAKKSETLSTELLAQRVRDVKSHFAEDYIREKVSRLTPKAY